MKVLRPPRRSIWKQNPAIYLLLLIPFGLRVVAGNGNPEFWSTFSLIGVIAVGAVLLAIVVNYAVVYFLLILRGYRAMKVAGEFSPSAIVFFAERDVRTKNSLFQMTGLNISLPLIFLVVVDESGMSGYAGIYPKNKKIFQIPSRLMKGIDTKEIRRSRQVSLTVLRFICEQNGETDVLISLAYGTSFSALFRRTRTFWATFDRLKLRFAA